MAADRQRLAAALAYEEERRRRMMESVPVIDDSAPTTEPRRSLRSDLENLSSGLGQAGVNILEGGKALLTDPIGTVKGTYETVKGVVRDPSLIADALRYTADKAMSGPLGAGEVIGEMVNPVRFRRTPAISQIDEFDPRFDDRVKEQARLKALTPIVESRGTINAPEVSLTEFEGRPFIISQSDRTAAGGELKGVNDVMFNLPVNLRGGQDFMFENPRMVWASGTTPTNTLQKMALEAKEATGQNPLFLPYRMTPSGGDFAAMTGETMLNYADAAMSAATKREVNQKIKQFIPDWAGLGSEKGIKQYQKSSQAIRDAIREMLDVNYRNEGGLNIGEARLAVADPRQYTAADTGLQNVGEIFAGTPTIAQSGHPSYPAGLPGQGLGILKEDVQAYQLLPNLAAARGMSDPRQPNRRDYRSLMQPRSGVLTAELLKRLGF